MSIEAPARERDGVLGRIEGIRDRVRAKPGGGTAWRIGVTTLGVTIIAGGIVLLPLPGPGWLIIFAGLGLLGTEYEWAHRLLTWVKAQVQGWWRWLERRPWWVRLGVAAVTALFVVAILGAVTWWYFLR